LRLGGLVVALDCKSSCADLDKSGPIRRSLMEPAG
jgi:hypothetical protein